LPGSAASASPFRAAFPLSGCRRTGWKEAGAVPPNAPARRAGRLPCGNARTAKNATAPHLPHRLSCLRACRIIVLPLSYCWCRGTVRERVPPLQRASQGSLRSKEARQTGLAKVGALLRQHAAWNRGLRSANLHSNSCMQRRFSPFRTNLFALPDGQGRTGDTMVRRGARKRKRYLAFGHLVRASLWRA